MVEQSDYGGSKSTNPEELEAEELEAEVKAALDTTVELTKQKLESVTPVTVDFGDTVPSRTPQANTATSSGRGVRTPRYRRTFTPVSADFSDSIRITPQNRRWEQLRKELADKQIAAVPMQFEYTPTRSFTPASSKVELPVLRKGTGRSSAPSASLLGSRNYAQPEEYAGGIPPHKDIPIPQTIEEMRAALESAKHEVETIERTLSTFTWENRNSTYADTSVYAALNQEYSNARQWYEKLQRQLGLLESSEEYSSKNYEDDFFGQWGANADVGKLTEDINAAYYAFLEDPSEENLAYAKRLEAILDQFMQNNAAVLDSDGAVLPLLSKDLAGYVPQWWNQQKAGIGNGISGATLAALATSYTGIGAAPAAKWGFKAGYSAGVGQYSYEQMSGAAYRELISWGIDDETARIAAKDEGVVSGFIEAADALGDVLTFGSGKLLKCISNKTAQKILSALAKYGINLHSEGVEEGSQQAVSIANRERILSGKYDSDAGWLDRKLDLAGDSVKVLWDAYTGKNDEARSEIHNAASGGRRLGLFSAGAGTVSNVLHDSFYTDTTDQTASNTDGDAGQSMTETEQDTKAATQTQKSTVQSPIERGIMLWEQQYLEAIEQVELQELSGKSDMPVGYDTDSDTDAALDSRTSNEADELDGNLEQTFLFALQSDSESDIILDEEQKETTDVSQKPLTAQELHAMVGEALLDKGGMPSQVQLQAMGIDEATARGIQSLVLLSKENDPAARRAVEAMIDITDGEPEPSQRQNSDINLIPSKTWIDSPEDVGTEFHFSEAAMMDTDAIGSNQIVGDSSNSGTVEFKAPPNATLEQIAQVRAYVDGCNDALKAGKLSKTGRVSTKGSLRDQASEAAKKEARRARNAGTPYRGHVSHVPDTTWTGTPEPYSWLDLDPVVNTSLGGQTNRYPIGYKPTGFVFKEDEQWIN